MIIPQFNVLLVLSIVAASSYTAFAVGDTTTQLQQDLQDVFPFQENQLHRELQGLACGEVYESYTLEQIQNMTSQRYLNRMPVPQAALLAGGILPQLKFGVQFRKVCASCDSIIQEGDVDASLLHDEHFLEYCGEDVYGSDTVHSGMAMFPMSLEDDGSYSIVRAKDQLQTWFQYRSVSISNTDSFLLLTSDKVPSFFNQLIASSAGLVSLSFHETGHDESHGLVPSPLNRKSIVTGSLPIFYKVRSMLLDETDGISYLGNEAYFAGQSQGGNSAISAAESFKLFGIQPIHVFAGSAPIKARSEAILGILRSILGGTVNAKQLLSTMLISLPMSNTRHCIPNYGSGQYVLSDDTINDALLLFTDQSAPLSIDPSLTQYLFMNYPQLVAKMNTSPLDLLGPQLKGLFLPAVQTGDNDPCTNKYNQGIGQYDKLCDALNENDLREVVAEADFKIDICHSRTDDFISYENVPDEYDSSLVTIYTTPNATHLQSSLLCSARVAGMVSQSPLRTPTLYSCSDRTDAWKIGRKTLPWCKWANKKQGTEISERCAKKNLNDDCPGTCHGCTITPLSCSDRTDAWKIGRKTLPWCKWANKKRGTEISERCAKKNLNAHCPRTCLNCA